MKVIVRIFFNCVAPANFVWIHISSDRIHRETSLYWLVLDLTWLCTVAEGRSGLALCISDITSTGLKPLSKLIEINVDTSLTNYLSMKTGLLSGWLYLVSCREDWTIETPDRLKVKWLLVSFDDDTLTWFSCQQTEHSDWKLHCRPEGKDSQELMSEELTVWWTAWLILLRELRSLEDWTECCHLRLDVHSLW